MSFIPYPQQLAVKEHFANPKSGSLIVEARAGGGKTTTILESVLDSNDVSTLICAFNKRIQEDMEGKLQERSWSSKRLIEVRTLHSLGFKLLREHWRGVQFNNKSIDALIKQHTSLNPRARFQLGRLITHCKDVHPHLHVDPKAIEKAKDIIFAEVKDFRILESPSLVHEIADTIVKVMQASLQRRDEISYADMVWVPVACNMQPRGRYRRVVVDEAQDMSQAQFELIERFVAPGGGLVIVGDIFQSIYQWRGADASSIWRRLREKWNARVLPLTVSFRCAKRVIEEAKQLVPDIEPRTDAPEGIVDEIESPDLVQHAKPGDFVLSRTNAALIVAAVDMWLRNGPKPVIEGGRDIAEPVFQILDKLSVSTPASYDASLERWYHDQVARSNSNTDSGTWTDLIEDWYKLLKGVGTRVGPKRVREVLQTIFDFEPKGKKPASDFSIDLTSGGSLDYVSFSTVHKAKGLEADRVFLLKQSFARYQEHDEDDEIEQEELNIEYVGITRARKHLTWVNIALDEAPETEKRKATRVRAATSVDAAIDSLERHFDQVAYKHHGDVPAAGPELLPTPKEIALASGQAVIVPHATVNAKFQNLTKPHTPINGTCTKCGKSMNSVYAMSPCEPVRRVFAAPKKAAPPKRVFPPARKP
jgi:hypothetical protein